MFLGSLTFRRNSDVMSISDHHKRILLTHLDKEMLDNLHHLKLDYAIEGQKKEL